MYLTLISDSYPNKVQRKYWNVMPNIAKQPDAKGNKTYNYILNQLEIQKSLAQFEVSGFWILNINTVCDYKSPIIYTQEIINFIPINYNLIWFLTTPVGWLLLLPLTFQSRPAIVV